MIEFKNIQITNLENGRPCAQIADERCKGLCILITLSHTEEYATATAVVQQ